MNPKKEIERHRLPCGPMTIAVDGVCRRRLRDHFDALLDRLTEETHQHGVDEDILDLEEKVQDDVRKETPQEKRDRMIEEGKLKVDVKKIVRDYEEEVMGNSKMLQDISGKIKPR